VTCIVDGDTGWEDGVKWRLYSVDTPELSRPACTNERRKAIAARDRLRDLMGGGYRLDWIGRSGSYGRKLVRIKLADGRYAGRVLIQEGLAQPWPNSGNIWCGF
jgi:endonuclease YncB( thermonuclease family)